MGVGCLPPAACRPTRLRPVDDRTNYHARRTDDRLAAAPTDRAASRSRDDRRGVGRPPAYRARDGRFAGRRLSACRSTACVRRSDPNDRAACCSTADRSMACRPTAFAARAARWALSATADRWAARCPPACSARVCVRAVDPIDRAVSQTMDASRHQPVGCSMADHCGACPATADCHPKGRPVCRASRCAASPHIRACPDRAASRDPSPTTRARDDSSS
jgi:hypothetical protein